MLGGLTVALLACTRDRYRRDVESICAATVTPGVDADEWRRIDSAIDTIERTLQTPDGRRLAGRLREASADPAAVLAAEASRVGVAPCSLSATMGVAEGRLRYRHDITMLCGYALDALRPEHFLSEEGRQLHARLSSLSADGRHASLMTEARQLGLTTCAMAEGKP